MKVARDELDRIDEAILALLGRRGRVVSALWAQKAAAGVPTADAERERDIFRRLRAEATAAGMDPDAVERVFREVVGRTFGSGG
ncbi:MAG: chorismate mutase [Myxococcales bacterium]|nr:chorismate mutase [Myxococcales bacterium]